MTISANQTKLNNLLAMVQSLPDAQRCKAYTLTIPKSSGWVELITLDQDVLSHINDQTLVVMLTINSTPAYEWYAGTAYVASNHKFTYNTSQSAYGYGNRMQSETNTAVGHIQHPANDNGSSADVTAEMGRFKISGNKYYLKPGDGFICAGTYTLRFMW